MIPMRQGYAGRRSPQGRFRQAAALVPSRRAGARALANSVLSRSLRVLFSRHMRTLRSRDRGKSRAQACQVRLCGKFAAGTAVEFQRTETGMPRILIETSNRRIADDVAAPPPETRHRHAARQGFQQHQSERYRCGSETQKHRRMRRCRQVPPLASSRRTPLRDRRLPNDARRAIADNQLGAGQIELEKRLEILFNRDARPTARKIGRGRSRPSINILRRSGLNSCASTPRDHPASHC